MVWWAANSKAGGKNVQRHQLEIAQPEWVCTIHEGQIVRQGAQELACSWATKPS